MHIGPPVWPKILFGIGLLFCLLGLIGHLWVRSGLPNPGSLPGDMSWRRGGFSFYFPLGTSILISIVLTLVLWLISATLRR